MVYKRYKYDNPLCYQSSAKEAGKEVGKANYNYEKKLTENMKKDNKSFYACV